jgi:DegV family protein with EDD domain
MSFQELERGMVALSEKTLVITDSVACLTKELIERYEIEIVPIKLLIKGKVYRDYIDISASEAYQLFQQDPESFKTSPSSPADYLEAYRQTAKRASNILCVTLSSKLSSAYEMAGVAKEQAHIELPQVAIEVVDSLNVTASEGFIVLAAARAAQKGSTLAEAVRIANDVRSRVTFLAYLDTIRYVYRTGRIPRLASQVGSRLNIKPILTVVSGLIRLKTVALSAEQGINRMLATMRDRIKNRPVHVHRALDNRVQPCNGLCYRDRYLGGSFLCR